METVIPTHITAEPLFYGEERHTKGVTAEDFITKLVVMKTGYAINDAQMVARAVGYLREAASSWWHDSIDFTHTARKFAATTDFDAFVTLFKEAYFKVATVTDLSCDYATLRQRNDESATAFLRRAAGAFAQHVRMRPDILLSEASINRMVNGAAEVAEAAAAAQREWPDLPAAIRNDYIALVRDFWIEAVRAERKDFLGDIGIKIVTQGLKLQKHQELVRKWEREGKSFTEISEAMQQVEKDAASRPPMAIIPKTTIPAIIKAVDGLDMDDEDQAEVAAVKKQGKGKKAKKQQQKQGGSGSFSSSQQQQKGGNFIFHKSNANGNSFRPRSPRRPCRHCQNDNYNLDPTKWHWDNDCPTQKYRNFSGNKASASAGGDSNANAESFVSQKFNNNLN
jgi:hypothetical protein